MQDIADLVSLAQVLAAQNRASGEMTARIWADMDGKKGYGTAEVLSHESMPLRHNLSLLYIKLSNGDGIAGRTRRTLETKRCETEGEFVNLRCR